MVSRACVCVCVCVLKYSNLAHENMIYCRKIESTGCSGILDSHMELVEKHQLLAKYASFPTEAHVQFTPSAELSYRTSQTRPIHIGRGICFIDPSLRC